MDLIVCSFVINPGPLVRAVLLVKFEQIEPLGAWLAESVRGAFATRQGGQVDSLRVLLVDDVWKTGATLDARVRAVREAGAKSAVGLTGARAIRNPLPSSVEW